MKVKSIILTVLLLFVATVTIKLMPFKTNSASSAQIYVNSITVNQTDDNAHMRLCWQTVTLPKVTPQIRYLVTGNVATENTITPNNLVSGGPTATGTLNCGSITSLTGAAELTENTSYTFYIEYVDTSLSGYSDYDTSRQRIVSEAFEAKTAKKGLRFTTINNSYAFPGEKVRLYGENIGASPNDFSSLKAYLGPLLYTTSSLAGNIYEFPVTGWGVNYIEFSVPAYDASKLYQRGTLYLPFLVQTESSARIGELEMVRVLSGYGDVDRSVASGYTNALYRYLINATLYRYNNERSSATHGQEGTKMQWIRSYLNSQGRGIDALWSTVLAYALVYGGYTENEVKQEIRYGPGCVHVSFTAAVWRTTTDYKLCMEHGQ